MKELLKWVVIPGAALVFATAGHGQTATSAAANPSLRPTRTITGTVFDPSGAPAPGVELFVVPQGGFLKGLKSDAVGKFTLSWQPFTPAIQDILVGRDWEHNFAATADIGDNTTNMDLHLKPGLFLSGSVQDNNGAAVKTATVHLSILDGNWNQGFDRPLAPPPAPPVRVQGGGWSTLVEQPLATVDEQGAFTFSALPQGEAYNLTVTAPGFGKASVPVATIETERASLKWPPIKLKPTDQRLEGRVVGLDDKPVPGAAVRVIGTGLNGADQLIANAVTDANGHFALKVYEGTFRITAMAPNNQNNNGQIRPTSVQAQSGDLDVVLKLGAANSAPAAPPRVNNQPPPQSRLPNRPPTRTITGTVYDPSGAPAPGVLLLIVDPVNGPGLGIRSDADGKYALSWQSPRTTRNMVVDGMTLAAMPVDRFCTLVARDVAHNFATAFEIGDTATNLDVRLQPGLAVSFKVEDPTGKPVTNATANLGASFSGVAFMLIFNPPTYADNKGVIRMAGLPQGYHYTMNIRAPGYGSAVTTTGEDQTQTARLDRPPVVLQLANLKLAGQVLDADGKPAIARVSFIGAGQPSTNTESDATGHFSLDVCEGSVNLFANWQDLVGRAQASGGDTNVVIRLADKNAVQAAANANAAAAARRTVTITGTVYDPSGAPAPGVEMSLMPRGQSQDSKSDAGGKFTVSWPPVTMWNGGARPVIQLLVGRDLEHNFAATASVDENTTNMDLHLKAGLVLSGSVQDHNGAAVNTATVRLTMTITSTSSAVGPQPATVDEQGAFTFSALPQGRSYDLTVTAPGFAYTNVLVAATDTQTASLKLPPTRLKPKNKRLEGWVLGPDDKPVPGATVMVSGAGQAIDSAHTDANGHFALMVCEGTVRVTAMVPNNQNNNGQLRSSSVQAQSGDLDVVLKLGVPAPPPRGNNPAPPNNPPVIGPM